MTYTLNDEVKTEGRDYARATVHRIAEIQKSDLSFDDQFTALRDLWVEAPIRMRSAVVIAMAACLARVK